MRRLFTLLAVIAVGVAGVASELSFIMAMWRAGNLLALLIGLLFSPVTMLLWPALSGAAWAPTFYAVVVAGFVVYMLADE